MQTIDERYLAVQFMKDMATRNNEPSMHIMLEDIGRKDLLIAMASYIEHKTIHILTEFFQSALINPEACSFISKTALERNFYKLFDFNTSNANALFGKFGSKFKDVITKKNPRKCRH